MDSNHNSDVFLDPFDEDDDEILAQAYDDSIGLENHYEKPGPSLSRSNGPKILESPKGFDYEAGKTWIYPINYPLREYQYAIVEQSLLKNTLVSLPTGLGKTFIAAVLMYNFYRWYPRSKIIFMAPTKPLVAQQVEACFNIVGIRQSDISQMTGSVNPELRAQAWKDKRIFFLTPQVLTNDLARGACPGELIKCLVLDEAHRATGNHAYCQVVRELQQHRYEFRVLALTATPGSDVRAVKEVLKNLMISHIELRSEDSPDIKPYSHHRHIEKVVIPLGEELTNIKNRYLNVLRIYVNRLLDLKVLFTRDETTLSKYQILQARDSFRQNPPESVPRHRFGAVEGLFALCVTLYHAFDLMLLHGTRSSYKFLKGTLEGDKGKSFARAELLRNEVFRRLMDDLSKKFEGENNENSNASIMNTSKESYVISHPKMSHLCKLVVDHHKKFDAEGKSTRIMIFSQYRDSVLEITAMLRYHEPLVKAMSFVGQGAARSTRGISQKEQLRVVKQFKEGGFNTLVSTCVGEEGLDIGDVDLIVCYDAPKSPIRLVQRMGRTGRKREGRIVVLITKGKEEQMYNQSQYQKKSINVTLANREKLIHHLYAHCSRMIPPGITPVCQKLHMKVDEWEPFPNKRKKKNSSSNTPKRLSSTRSTSSRKEKHGFLSEEEWNWYKENLWLPSGESKSIAQPSMQCLKKEESEGDHIELGCYQPWQTSLQPTHLFGHSSRTEHLVQLTEFIDLQTTLEGDEDPYGLEMAAFLDMAYVRDDDAYQEQEVIASPPKPVIDKKEPKKKSKAGKHKAVKNNVLITSMFQKVSASATSKSGESSQSGVVSASQCRVNWPNQKVDDPVDDDVIVLDDGFNISSQKVSPTYASTSKASQSVCKSPTFPKKDEDMVIEEDDLIQEGLNLSSGSMSVEMPPQCSVSPFRVLTPPNCCSPLDGDLTEDLVSPSDVVAAVSDWIEVKAKVTLADYHSLSKTVSYCFGTENQILSDVKRNRQIKSKSASKLAIKLDDERDELPDLTKDVQGKIHHNGILAFCKTSVIKEPVEVKVYAEDSEFDKNHSVEVIENNAKSFEFVSGMDMDPIDGGGTLSTVNEVSPILSSSHRKPVRTNLKVCASTPKLHARRLFKVATPDLTAIEKNTMLHVADSCLVTPNREEITVKEVATISKGASTPRRENITMTADANTYKGASTPKRKEIAITDGKSTSRDASTPKSSPKIANNKDRIRSKLSKFSLVSKLNSDPEKCDVTSKETSQEIQINAVTSKEIPNSPFTSKEIQKSVVTSNEIQKSEETFTGSDKFSDKYNKHKLGVTNFAVSDVRQNENGGNIVSENISVDYCLGADEKLILQDSLCLKKDEQAGMNGCLGFGNINTITSKEARQYDRGKDKSESFEEVVTRSENSPRRDEVNDSPSRPSDSELSPDLIRSSLSPRKDVSSSLSLLLPGTGSKKKIPVVGNVEKVAARSVEKLADKAVSAGALDKITFDLSMDEDIFADLDMNELDKKDDFASPLEKGKLNSKLVKESKNIKSAKDSSDINPVKDSRSSINFTQQSTSKLLSVTQIIDLVDVSDVNLAGNDQSVVNSSSCGLVKPSEGLLVRNSPLTSKLIGSLRERASLQDNIGESSISVSDKPHVKKPSLLCKKTKSKESKETAGALCPNFSLMDGIDFDLDDDLESEMQNAASANFDLLGTQEFQPKINSHKKINESSIQNSSFVGKKPNKTDSQLSTSGYLNKSDLKTNDSVNFSVLDNFSPKLKKTIEGSERTPKRLSFGGKSSVSHDSLSKKSLLESPKNIPLTQENAYVWKRRERKACNVVDSDSEEHSFHKDNSEDSHSKTSLCKTGSSTNQESINLVDDDDDDDFASNEGFLYRQPGLQKADVKERKRLKSKGKENHFINREAEVSCDGIEISSDENEDEDEYANDSFVDDCTELSQDPNVDIKAMYLKSIVSPVKKPSRQRQLPIICLSDTEEESGGEGDESEDSFVVANDVVEYNTEYMGDSMLAEDSIMLQAMEDNFRCNKMKASGALPRNKRKRIILNDSSSEEEADKTGTLKGDDQDCSKHTRSKNSSKKMREDDEKFREPVSSAKAFSSSHRSKATDNVVNHSNRISFSGQNFSNSQNSDTKVNPQTNIKNIEHSKGHGTLTHVNKVMTSSSKGKNSLAEVNNGSEGFDVTRSCEGHKKEATLNAGQGGKGSLYQTVEVGEELEDNIPVTSRSTSMGCSRQANNQRSASTDLSVMEKSTVSKQIPGLVLVDSHEINGGAGIISKLKMQHSLNTAVVQLTYGHYAVSTRMVISKLHLSVFSSSQNRDNLKKRVQGMLSMFERSVIIVEMDKVKHGDSPYNSTHIRSKYIDTITCACAQVTQLKVLYSSGQEETAKLIWQLVEQERSKGYNIPVLPAEIQQWQKVITFYRSLPRVSYVTALCLARNFRTLNEFFNSSIEVIQNKGCMSYQRASEVHQFINRSFRADMLLN